MAGKGRNKVFAAAVDFKATGMNRVLRDFSTMMKLIEREQNMQARLQERSQQNLARAQERAAKDVIRLTNQIEAANQRVADLLDKSAQNRLEEANRIKNAENAMDQTKIRNAQRIHDMERRLADMRAKEQEIQKAGQQRISELITRRSEAQQKIDQQILSSTRRLQEAQTHYQSQVGFYQTREKKQAEQLERVRKRLLSVQQQAADEMNKNGSVTAATQKRLESLQARYYTREKALGDTRHRLAQLNERIISTQERINSLQASGQQKAAALTKKYDSLVAALQNRISNHQKRTNQYEARIGQLKLRYANDEQMLATKLQQLKDRYSAKEKRDLQVIERLKRRIAEQEIKAQQAISRAKALDKAKTLNKTQQPAGVVPGKGGGGSLLNMLGGRGLQALAQGATGANSFASALAGGTMRLAAMSGALATAGGLLTALGGGFALAGAAAGSAYTKLELFEVQLQSLTGSARMAEYAMSSFTNLSMDIPMDLDSIRQGGLILEAVGVHTYDLAAELKTLGNISIATGSQLDDLAVIYGEIKTKGRMFREDVLQMSRRRIPIAQEISNQLGITVTKFNELVSAGEISFEVFQEALENITTKNGILGDQLEAVSKTFIGKTQLMANTYKAAWEQFGKASYELVEGPIHHVLGFFQQTGDNLLALTQGVSRLFGVDIIEKNFESIGYAAKDAGHTIESVKKQLDELTASGQGDSKEAKNLRDMLTGLELLERQTKKNKSAIDALRKSMRDTLSPEMQKAFKDFSGADPSDGRLANTRRLKEMIDTIYKSNAKLGEGWDDLSLQAKVQKAIEGASGIYAEMRNIKQEIALMNEELTETDVLMQKMRLTGVFDIDSHQGKLLEDQYRTLLEQREQARQEQEARERWRKSVEDLKKEVEQEEENRIRRLQARRDSLLDQADPFREFSRNIQEIMDMRRAGQATPEQARIMFGQIGKNLGMSGPDPETFNMRNYAAEMEQRALKANKKDEMQQKMYDLWDAYVRGDTAATTKIINAIKHDLRARAR